MALTAEREAVLGVTRASFERVLAESDIVTLHLPLSAGNRHLIDAGALAGMKPGAVLINTARGAIVDQAALIEALESGHLGGAGLDVFEDEPPPADCALFGFRNVVVTPHIAAGTRDALQSKMRALFDNVARFYRGEPLENEIDLSVEG